MTQVAYTKQQVGYTKQQVGINTLSNTQVGAINTQSNSQVGALALFTSQLGQGGYSKSQLCQNISSSQVSLPKKSN